MKVNRGKKRLRKKVIMMMMSSRHNRYLRTANSASFGQGFILLSSIEADAEAPSNFWHFFYETNASISLVGVSGRRDWNMTEGENKGEKLLMGYCH